MKRQDPYELKKKESFKSVHNQRRSRVFCKKFNELNKYIYQFITAKWSHNPRLLRKPWLKSRHDKMETRGLIFTYTFNHVTYLGRDRGTGKVESA